MTGPSGAFDVQSLSAKEAVLGQWRSNDLGWLAWTNDPAANSGGAAVVAGYLFCNAIKIPVGVTTVTNIVMDVYTAGATLTSGQCKAALYQGGALLGVTADQSTAWTSVGVKTMALTAPVTVASGLAYVALWAKGTTMPVMGAPAGASGNAVNGGAFKRGAFDIATAAAVTTTPPATLSTLNNYPAMWAAIS